MGFKVDVTGIDETIEGLKKYFKSVEDNIKDVVKESAVNIESKSKMKAPVDTGNLRRGITHQVLDNGLDAEIGTYDIEYAPYIEYGTSKNPAKPYLRPSLEEELPNFQKLLERAVKKAGV